MPAAILSGMEAAYGAETWQGKFQPFHHVWKNCFLYPAAVLSLLGYMIIAFFVENPVMAVRFLNLLFTYLILALVDGKLKVVPNRILFCFFGGQMLLGIAETHIFNLLSCLITGAVFALVLLAFAWLSRGRLGMGDAKLLGATAMTAGWLYTFQLICWSFIPAFIYSIWLLLFRKVSMKTEFPFVPFLFAGLIIQVICLWVA